VIDFIPEVCNYPLAVDIDQARLWLACKGTPIQIGDDTSITERGGMINSTLLWIEVWTDPFQKSINCGELHAS